MAFTSELLGKLRQRHRLPDRFKRNLGFELPLSSRLCIDCRAARQIALSFFIPDHVLRHAIHLTGWSKYPRHL
jgi:hypothetical protein